MSECSALGLPYRQSSVTTSLHVVQHCDGILPTETLIRIEQCDAAWIHSGFSILLCIDETRYWYLPAHDLLEYIRVVRSIDVFGYRHTNVFKYS
jgi:hypothetical protein